MGRNRIKVYGDDTRKAGRQLMDLTCDGANDDVQIQRAIESLASGTVVIDCFGDFNIGDTLDFDGNAADTKRYIFNHYGNMTTSSAIPIIRLGNTQEVRDSVFNLGYIYKSGTARAAGAYGINAISMVHSRVTFQQIVDFEKGIYINANATGVAANNWIGQTVNTCDIGIHLIGSQANVAENNTFLVKWLINAYDKCLYLEAFCPNTIFLGTDITTVKTKGVAPDPVVDAYCIYDDVGYNHFLCSMVIQDNDATHKFAGSAINNSFYGSVLHNIYHYPNNSDLDILSITKLGLKTSTELTIASGIITITQSNHTVDTQSDAGTDDLDTINGGTTGQIILLRAVNSARTVVVKHGTGNIQCGADVSLDNANDTIMLFYDGSNWLKLSSSDNGA